MHNLVLTLNNFLFNGINYLQEKGCGMDTICACVYANIFKTRFEKYTFTSTLEIFQHFTVDL